MSASPPLHPPFAEVLATLCYCLLHPAESSDAAMHSDAWVCSVFVSWRRLHTAWIYGEEGFLDDRKWMVLEGQIWGLLAQINQDLVNDYCDEYNDLVAEALKCGINIEPIEMETDSKSEKALSPAQSPEPRIVEVRVPWLPAGFCAPLPQVLSPPVHIPSPSPAPDSSPAPPIASSSHLHKHILSSDEEQSSPSKSLHPALPSPPCLTPEQKKKGPGSKLCGHPCKIKEETVAVICKCRGLGEPIPKNARAVTHEDLRPMGLLIPDQDFGDYIGCQGAFFKRELIGKVGHFMSVPCDACSKARVQCCSIRSGSAKCFRYTIHKHDCVVQNQSYVNTLEPVFVPETHKFRTFTLITEIRGLLKDLIAESHQMNNTNDNILSLFQANHLDNIELVAELFERGITEGEALLDLEAEEAGSDEDPEVEEDKLQGDE
ncbi:hypothetical protein ARMGADRAFT_1078414 [Armillaria gallica]|uniref:Uncharacterized protein n=1 Tax=Armillaria gallica TaxID=47427 RepID=A0A2H3DH71_ARMGA|nr:hypothetical protein ARMGADRAFT_1078414 [Armillaria gallica]